MSKLYRANLAPINFKDYAAEFNTAIDSIEALKLPLDEQQTKIQQEHDQLLAKYPRELEVRFENMTDLDMILRNFNEPVCVCVEDGLYVLYLMGEEK
jgi:hypothetical protein